MALVAVIAYILFFNGSALLPPPNQLSVSISVDNSVLSGYGSHTIIHSNVQGGTPVSYRWYNMVLGYNGNNYVLTSQIGANYDLTVGNVFGTYYFYVEVTDLEGDVAASNVVQVQVNS